MSSMRPFHWDHFEANPIRWDGLFKNSNSGNTEKKTDRRAVHPPLDTILLFTSSAPLREVMAQAMHCAHFIIDICLHTNLPAIARQDTLLSWRDTLEIFDLDSQEAKGNPKIIFFIQTIRSPLGIISEPLLQYILGVHRDLILSEIKHFLPS